MVGELFQKFDLPKDRCFFSRVKWLRWILSFLTDHHYDSKNLEQTLKQAVDSKRRVFDIQSSNLVGCRVAFTTSRVSDGKACFLATYSGVSRKLKDTPYEFLAPGERDESPFLWEA